MRIIIKTIYENANEEWLEWWLSNLDTLPSNHKVTEALRKTGKAIFESKDPSSDVIGRTEYEIIREE